MLKAVIYTFVSGFFDESKVQENSIYLTYKAFQKFKCVGSVKIFFKKYF